MATIIFDIDGTLTYQWPLEQAVLEAMMGDLADMSVARRLAGGNLYKIFSTISGLRVTKSEFRSLYRKELLRLQQEECLPQMIALPSVAFIKENKSKYRFVYATGGVAVEATYVLGNLGILPCFDIANSISADTYRFSKTTGLPFRRLQNTFGPRLVLCTDSVADVNGAQKAGVASILLGDKQAVTRTRIEQLLKTV